MEYNVVYSSGEDLREFVNKVNGWIKNGWEPVGGMFVQRYSYEVDEYYTENNTIYYQAVIKSKIKTDV